MILLRVFLSFFALFSLSGCVPLMVDHHKMAEDRAKSALAQMKMVVPHVKRSHLDACLALARKSYWVYSTEVWGGRYNIVEPFRPSIRFTCANIENLTNVVRGYEAVAAYAGKVQYIASDGKKGNVQPFACKFGLKDGKVVLDPGKVKAPRGSVCHTVSLMRKQ